MFVDICPAIISFATERLLEYILLVTSSLCKPKLDNASVTFSKSARLLLVMSKPVLSMILSCKMLDNCISFAKVC